MQIIETSVSFPADAGNENIINKSHWISCRLHIIPKFPSTDDPANGLTIFRRIRRERNDPFFKFGAVGKSAAEEYCKDYGPTFQQKADAWEVARTHVSRAFPPPPVLARNSSFIQAFI